jgi:hypothetical protein
LKIRRLTETGQWPQPTGDAPPGGCALPQVHEADESSEALDGAMLLRVLEADQHIPRGLADIGQLPRVRRMPDGIEVVEQRIGVAAGQWVLRVRCQCGRSWFEVEAVHWGICPRCGLLVRVNVEASGAPG